MLILQSLEYQSIVFTDRIKQNCCENCPDNKEIRPIYCFCYPETQKGVVPQVLKTSCKPVLFKSETEKKKKNFVFLQVGDVDNCLPMLCDELGIRLTKQVTTGANPIKLFTPQGGVK